MLSSYFFLRNLFHFSPITITLLHDDFSSYLKAYDMSDVQPLLRHHSIHQVPSANVCPEVKSAKQAGRFDMAAALLSYY